MNHDVLIIDSDTFSSRMEAALLRVVSAIPPSRSLRVLGFVETGAQARVAHVVSGHSNASQVDTTELLNNTYFDGLERIIELVSSVRRRMERLVGSQFGPEAASCFARLWWYGALSEKNVLGEYEWWKLLRFLAIKKYLTSVDVNSCYFVGSRELDALLEQYCNNAGISYESELLSSGRRKSLSSLMRRRFRLGWRHLRAGMLARKSVSKPESFQRTLGLCSHFPRKWTERFGVKLDMYYDDVETLLKKADTSHAWFYRLFDDRDLGVTESVFRQRLQRAVEEGRTGGGVILEYFLQPKDVLKPLMSFHCDRGYRKLRSSKAFRECFDWEGINTFESLISLLDRSVHVHWPYFQSLEKMVAKAFGQCCVNTCVMYGFEYAWGRAWMNGVRRGAPGTVVIGMQHGPATTAMLKGDKEDFHALSPIPWPDAVAVDGELSAEHLRQRGVSEESLLKVGPARFDSVWAYARSRAERSQPGVKSLRLLVAPGLQDTERFLQICVPAVAGIEGVEVIIRPHPKVSDEYVSAIVREHLDRNEQKNIRVDRGGHIYRLMDSSDLMVVSYSSVGIEALFFGVPAIVLTSGEYPDLSLFRATSVPVLTAGSVEELREHLLGFINGNMVIQEYLTSIMPAFRQAFTYGRGDSLGALIGESVKVKKRVM